MFCKLIPNVYFLEYYNFYLYLLVQKWNIITIDSLLEGEKNVHLWGNIV